MPVTINTDHESVEVDLWGALFYTQRITRSRQKEITRIEREVDALQSAEQAADDGDDQIVSLLGQMLDAMLEPAEGKRKKASAHIVERWEADALTIAELTGFMERLGEAVRPT
jgi:hypothetical protein